MEESKKGNTEILLGDKKLTIEQVMELPEKKRQKYIRGLTAKQYGDLMMGDFVKNINENSKQ